MADWQTNNNSNYNSNFTNSSSWQTPTAINDSDLMFDGKPLNLLHEENQNRVWGGGDLGVSFSSPHPPFLSLFFLFSSNLYLRDRKERLVSFSSQIFSKNDRLTEYNDNRALVEEAEVESRSDDEMKKKSHTPIHNTTTLHGQVSESLFSDSFFPVLFLFHLWEPWEVGDERRSLKERKK